MKKISRLIILIPLILSLCGCAAKNNSVQQNNNQQGRLSSNRNSTSTVNFEEDFNQKCLADLREGQMVSVMGSESGDGGIAANTIIIGDMRNFFGNLRPPDYEGAYLPSQGGIAVPSQGGQNQNELSNMPSLTPEQIAQFRKMRLEQGGSGGNVQAPGNGEAKKYAGNSQARVSGEILTLTPESFIIKLNDSGSKLIFVSSSTKVLEPKQMLSE